ncbi:hypothetical protein HOD30_01445 [Candidatus Peregrinibacteria bacterium]|jgi:hypothetical protein|nr:hypothetical protein [Candidatus Peregrinibacteria bacterium]MBT4632232.1 hypothetical protein [Candidatus Peregrinibacteria bacterium]MBT5516675.1 hypothetical protein [Candidatus Peregrinibacteria bacterium]MBT5824357.1 hypothetical protein [Candidatus Peregrinibacteria bacterium]
MNKLAIIAIITVILAGTVYGAKKAYNKKQLEGPPAPTISQITDGGIPKTLNLDLPFYTQAPHANWDYPWQEACEEASILLVANSYNNWNLDLETYNDELLKLVDWEVDYFGDYEHTSVDQTAEMLKINFELESTIHQNPTFADIQNILSKGNLIVAPFAGKLLKNPNFKNGGPTYHMLVIKGYDANKMQIVTHDVGTKNGEDYVYSWDTINKALHDWHDEDILLGEAKIIEVHH